MAVVHRRKSWEPVARAVTPQMAFAAARGVTRRRFLQSTAGFALGSALLPGLSACGPSEAAVTPREAERDAAAYLAEAQRRFAGVFPAALAPNYANAGRALTDASWATTYNNFYEFSEDKARVRLLVSQFKPLPWTVDVSGACHNPAVFDIDDLVRGFPQEERIYRFRCVEAWAMTVPWTGFPLRLLLERVQPTADAKFVRFLSFNRPKQAPGMRDQPWYTWPYYEALRIDEATHPLTLLCTGAYGTPLTKQNGAPLRVIVPWKYGYKSPKSIVRIELVASLPSTFWNDLSPSEYSFLSNVDPDVAHPRWSQQSERLLGEDERIPTQKYNGYSEVAGLY